MNDVVVIVADTSPLLNLTLIGQLDLVRRLFQRIRIPPAVWSELVDDDTAPGAKEIASQTSWIVIEAPDPNVVGVLLAQNADDLDIGEAEAIALAKAHANSLLLIDESVGRRVATEVGQRYFGTLGVLARAKREGYTPAIRPHIEALIAVGFWLSDHVVQKVLHEAGE